MKCFGLSFLGLLTKASKMESDFTEQTAKLVHKGIPKSPAKDAKAIAIACYSHNSSLNSSLNSLYFKRPRMAMKKWDSFLTLF